MKMSLKDLMKLIKSKPAPVALTGSKIAEPVKSHKWYEKMPKTSCFGAKSNLKGIFYNRRLRNGGYQGKKKIANFHIPQTMFLCLIAAGKKGEPLKSSSPFLLRVGSRSRKILCD
jgi:hypothetical protein